MISGLAAHNPDVHLALAGGDSRGCASAAVGMVPEEISWTRLKPLHETPAAATTPRLPCTTQTGVTMTWYAEGGYLPPELQGLTLATESLADHMPSHARDYIRHAYGRLSGGDADGGYLPAECGPSTVMTPAQHAELSYRYIQDTYGDDTET